MGAQGEHEPGNHERPPTSVAVDRAEPLPPATEIVGDTGDPDKCESPADHSRPLTNTGEHTGSLSPPPEAIRPALDKRERVFHVAQANIARNLARRITELLLPTWRGWPVQG